MGLAVELVGKIKAVLRERGIPYRDLAKQLGVSEATLKRGFSQNIFTLERIEQICTALGLTLADLAKPEEIFPIEHLSDAQEKALAVDEKLFVIFYLLLARVTPELIRQCFAFEEAEVNRILLKLDKLDLIRLHAGNRVETRVRQSFYWKPGGPLSERYYGSLQNDFMQSLFDGPNEAAWTTSGTISPAGLETMRKKITQVAADFRELIRLDSTLAFEEAVNVTFVAAYRPWTMPVIEKYRRKKQRRS